MIQILTKIAGVFPTYTLPTLPAVRVDRPEVQDSPRPNGTPATAIK